MSWKLVFQLSLFGMAIAFATVFWIPTNVEPAFWLVIFLVCAYLIAKRTPGRHFLHGFLVSIVNSIWVTTAHAVLFSTYIANHPDMAEMSARMPLAEYPLLMVISLRVLSLVLCLDLSWGFLLS
jgi:hypothetical protein